MRFDVVIAPRNLNAAGRLAEQAEAYGFDALWTAETAHNPFLPLTHAASATSRIQLGTAIALAFPRSPMVMAQIAWDLAAQSGGRFILGLGTQVRAHMVGRFSTPWAAPVPRLREYIEALRAIWATWQTGKPLRYGGQHYRFTLMTPFFSPGPIVHSDIPIYIAGVNTHLSRLAGAACQGFHVHPLHTTRYLREVIVPSVSAGAKLAGRTRAEIALACSVFVVTGRNDDAMREAARAARQQIAFYASTPSYRGIMDLHGWGDLADRLHSLSRQGEWQTMGSLIGDEMLNEIAVVAPPEELPHAVQERYQGLLDRVGYYLAFDPDDPLQAPLWRHTAQVFSS